MTRATGSASSTGGPINPIIRTKSVDAALASAVEYPLSLAVSVAITDEVFGFPQFRASYADDTAAALGGVRVDQSYRTTGNAVVVRLA